MDYVTCLEDFLPDFEAFIFDVYGVLHNGLRAIPETLAFLESLQNSGKTVCILSNAPFLTGHIVERLKTYGLLPSFYQHILTAGSETQRHLIEQDTPDHARLGPRCYFLGIPEMEEILQQTPLQKCSSLEEADFILAAGPNEWGQNLEDYQELLDLAFKRELPMVCANPDEYVFKGRERRLRAGLLARYYESIGGNVIYHGKPYMNFYKPVLDEISEIPKEKILCIGDSFKTDIKGARECQMKSLLVLSPLTYDEMGMTYDENPPRKETRKNIFNEISKQVYTPDYVTQLTA